MVVNLLLQHDSDAEFFMQRKKIDVHFEKIFSLSVETITATIQMNYYLFLGNRICL